MLHICSKPMVEKAEVGCLNYSSIFSELIHAASVCEYFASDVFIDLKAIERAIDNAETGVFFLGYRDSGVDGKSFVKSRLENDQYYHYIRLYRLEISIEYLTYGDYLTVELKRVDEYQARRELMEN